jgi:hypothetical protein
MLERCMPKERAARYDRAMVGVLQLDAERLEEPVNPLRVLLEPPLLHDSDDVSNAPNPSAAIAGRSSSCCGSVTSVDRHDDARAGLGASTSSAPPVRELLRRRDGPPGGCGERCPMSLDAATTTTTCWDRACASCARH